MCCPLVGYACAEHIEREHEVRKLAEQLVTAAFEEAIAAGELPLQSAPDPGIERPRDLSHGDWASSAAMRCAKQAHMKPADIAAVVAARIAENPAIAQVEVAGPGFINLRLSETALQGVFRAVREQGTAYGSSTAGAGQSVDLEFISANPTGPMHLGHGRWAALGDAMANVLAFAGYDVTREFYINDAGSQMDKFALSVDARYLQVARLVSAGQSVSGACQEIFENMERYREELPEDCYAGAYIVDIAARIYADEGARWVDADPEERAAHFKELAYTAVLDHTRELLHDFGLDFDVWYSERSTYAQDADGTSRLTRTLAALEEAGYLYVKEGATWFKTTEFGDDKDRVLVKADGSYTYFAPDIAYHKNKFDRGFDRCIDLLGADHHGYIKRIQSVGSVFGKPGQPEVVIGQLVNLFRDGKPVRMSKRTGEMVTFEELIDEVGADATRYTMLSRSTDQPIDFDIEKAKQQDSSNPVYYVQYAHARICSILRKADNSQASPDDIAQRLIPADADLSSLAGEPELALARKIAEFSDLAASCARDLAPFRLTHYCEELAAAFHQFYTKVHVLVDDAATTTARLYACDATRRVLASALGLLGVSAPERM